MVIKLQKQINNQNDNQNQNPDQTLNQLIHQPIFIILSDNFLNYDTFVKQAREKGVDYFFEKPLEPDSLKQLFDIILPQEDRF